MKFVNTNQFILELCKDRSFETRDSTFGGIVERYALLSDQPITLDKFVPVKGEKNVIFSGFEVTLNFENQMVLKRKISPQVYANVRDLGNGVMSLQWRFPLLARKLLDLQGCGLELMPMIEDKLFGR